MVRNATSTKPYDFTAPLTEDAAAYAHWKTEGYEDSRNWVIVGSGIGWTAEDAISFQKVEGSGNVFEVTVDVNLGDELKCTVLNPDGVLDYNNADGANVGFDLLTDPDGNFDEGSGLGDAPKNIICANAGNYTFTLTTDPVNSNNSLSAVRNGDVVGGNEPTGVVMPTTSRATKSPTGKTLSMQEQPLKKQRRKACTQLPCTW